MTKVNMNAKIKNITYENEKKKSISAAFIASKDSSRNVIHFMEKVTSYTGCSTFQYWCVTSFRIIWTGALEGGHIPLPKTQKREISDERKGQDLLHLNDCSSY